MRFKIDWASLIVGSKFTVFPLFFWRAIFQVQAPRGGGGWREGLYLEGRFYNNGRFFALRDWGPYKWSGLFSEFYGIPL